MKLLPIMPSKYNSVEELRNSIPMKTVDVEIKNQKGDIIFSQKDVEAPVFWSSDAINIASSKYFYGDIKSPNREKSVFDMFLRVVEEISLNGIKNKYFYPPQALDFKIRLLEILIKQEGCFNSPVLFNVGVEKNPQSSACFICSVEDSMESILDLLKTEGMIYKKGSGVGVNYSSLRSSKEFLTGGGLASGPVSFMKGADSQAGVIKSGGRVRRAASMRILNVNHPDILDFIDTKKTAENMAKSLFKDGWPTSFNDVVYANLPYQNANHSVRVSDKFMDAYINNYPWSLTSVDGKKEIKRVQARDIMEKIAEAAWECGDPGIQFDDQIQKWHTVPNSGRINASNPCSEYLHLDDSACNLASINLLKFSLTHKIFDVKRFKEVVEVFIIAQDILVGMSSYPTKKIEENSHNFRPLGLGFSNLGALLMSWGIPYDSDEARFWAGSISSLMTGTGYKTSKEMALMLGEFSGFNKNEKAMLNVMKNHGREAKKELTRYKESSILCGGNAVEILEESIEMWKEVNKEGSKFRNSQATVIAPTGTISFIMDCYTTGIEPELALVKYKTLVGGGFMAFSNPLVRNALANLGYSASAITEVEAWIEKNSSIQGAPHVSNHHLKVFRCSLSSKEGEPILSSEAHLKMMAAVQPFISGAISKTINLPKSATKEDIEKIYVQAWELNLKCVAIYRDGCKGSQPLSTSSTTTKEIDQEILEIKPLSSSIRRKLKEDREALIHKFSISGTEGYLIVGLYEDGTPGEIFIQIAKEGSTLSGLLDSFATSISLGLQYGIPLNRFIEKFSHTRFEPSGWTKDANIKFASSILDYIFRWLENRFYKEEIAELPPKEATQSSSNVGGSTVKSGPPCLHCGGLTIRTGTCHTCTTCFTTSGCS